jgi:hypothetical protein
MNTTFTFKLTGLTNHLTDNQYQTLKETLKDGNIDTSRERPNWNDQEITVSGSEEWTRDDTFALGLLVGAIKINY